MDPLLKDTIERNRRKSPGQKFLETIELMALGFEMQRSNLRRAHPDANEAELEALFRAWLQRADAGD